MNKNQNIVVKAATDGACSGNPGPGGWGALLRFKDGSIEEFGGHEPQTTNNRMELKALLEVLKRLKDLPLDQNLKIYTDSKYLINGLETWIINWKKKGWRTAAGKKVLNQDLWQALDSARIENVSLSYIKGHSGDPDNDRVDEIAVTFSKGLIPTMNCQGNILTRKQQPKHENSLFSGPPSLKLRKLVSKLEIADFLAKEGYQITVQELSELVDIPSAELKQINKTWQWRQWLIEPLGMDIWKLLPERKNINENLDLKDT